MPCTAFRLAALLPVAAALSGCMFLDSRYSGEVPPPNPPTFCYETIGRPACYDEPQFGMGDLINAQVPPPVIVPAPVVVQPVPVVASPTPVAIVPATVVEEPTIIKNPDPYPEPGDRAAPIAIRPY